MKLPLPDMVHITHPKSDRPIHSQKIRDLRDYWLSLKPEGHLPEWRDFSPLDIPELLPHLIVVDCLREPLQFRYRLIGTFVTRIAGRDSTNRMLDADLFGDRMEAMTWHYRHCAETAEPLATLGTVHFVKQDWVVAEHVFLPFAPPGGSVDIILAGLDTLDKSHWQSGYNHQIEPILDWRS